MPLLTAEVYDPQSGQWTSTESLHHSHEYGLLVAVADGAAMIGGDEPGQDTVVEIWRPDTEQCTKTIMPPFMSRVEGAWNVGDQLSDSRVLLTAGVSYGVGDSGLPVEFVTRECEVYDPAVGSGNRSLTSPCHT